MTKAKHTPAPWIVDGEDSLQGHPFISIHNSHEGSEAWRSICEVQPNGESGMKLVLSDEDKANAHLIAAAPELLEALEKMMKKYGGMYDEWQDVEIEARAAIAKAKGEA